MEARIDKFVFRIPETLLFSDAGIWMAVEESRARLGISDFVQQINGDIALANVAAAGTELRVGDEFGSIETVKVNLDLPSPVTGRIVEFNQLLQDTPEAINQDPYGIGWMVVVELREWEKDKVGLLDASRYLERVSEQAEAEL